MAAPSLVTSSAGATDAGTGWSYTGTGAGAAGRLMLLHVLQDGSTSAGAVSVTSVTNIENLAGTDNVMTAVTAGTTVGSPTVAYHGFWLGRSLNTTAPVVTGGNTTSDDIYIRMYEFENVSAGTTVATVIENGVAAYEFSRSTDTTVVQVSTTTNGPDRLAISLVAINDDATGIAAYTGTSGGTWTMAASYETATGTDGTLALMTATMASAGTISGGTATITSDAWGTLGFALIGTTVASPVDAVAEIVLQAVNRCSVW